MSSVFDRYSWQARTLPVYITISPTILALAAILPHGLDLPLGAATAISFAPAFSGSPKTPEIAPASPSRRPEASDKKSTDSRTLQASMFHNSLKYKRFLSLA